MLAAVKQQLSRYQVRLTLILPDSRLVLANLKVGRRCGSSLPL